MEVERPGNIALAYADFSDGKFFYVQKHGVLRVSKVNYMTSASDVKEATLRRIPADTKWTMTFLDWLDAGLAGNGARWTGWQEGLAIRYIGAGENGRSCRQYSRRLRGGAAHYRPI